MEQEYRLSLCSRQMALICGRSGHDRSRLLFLLPLAVESATMLKLESPTVPPNLERILRAYEKLKPDFEILEAKYIRPVVSQTPKTVEKFIGETSFEFIKSFSELTAKIVSNEGPQIMMDVMSAMGSENVSSALTNTVFDDRVMKTLRDAIALETENSMFLMGKYGQLLFSPDFSTIAESGGLDFDEFVDVSGKLYLSMCALVYGIWSKDAKNAPLMLEIAKLCRRYAEERDSLITTIDFTLDPIKRKSLENSYREYEKVVNSPA